MYKELTKQVTAVEFDQYLQVQFSGTTNMFDINMVEQLSGLDRDTIKSIMANYDDLKEVYSDDYDGYIKPN